MVPILLSGLFFLSKRGTLVCNWPSSKLAFERFILQKACLNTGFLLHFPNPCLGLMLNSNLFKKKKLFGEVLSLLQC